MDDHDDNTDCSHSSERSECNNYRAVNQTNTSRHKLEATGIRGCACARHGCFMPNSMINF
ncbi:hypothetical protein P692DRAFT_20739519 [Suillus brevipes Sb2]|nr:hypothetical protein P692DRAFT_20739519 [Suillus brevipes Sb2]